MGYIPASILYHYVGEEYMKKKKLLDEQKQQEDEYNQKQPFLKPTTA